MNRLIININSDKIKRGYVWIEKIDGCYWFPEDFKDCLEKSYALEINSFSKTKRSSFHQIIDYE